MYGDIIGMCEKALADFDSTAELLEYPEVQADKAYYLSVLEKYNSLNSLRTVLEQLKHSLEEERNITALLYADCTEEEKGLFYEELSAAKKNSLCLAGKLSSLLGYSGVHQRVLCRMRAARDVAGGICLSLYTLLQSNLKAGGAEISQENTVRTKTGRLQEISFIASGADVLTRLLPLAGAHKVYIASAQSDEVSFAVTPCEEAAVQISDKDIKIDLFHSSGAGGQNVNKVETAVRVTHIPTGIVVTCQDERSQLKNKQRALDTLEKRIKERGGAQEKARIEADCKRQFSMRNTTLSFDTSKGTMTDTRLMWTANISFPLTQEKFNQYIDNLVAHRQTVIG